MTSRPSVRLFVENRGEELMAEGIFAEHVREGRLTVTMCWTSSGVISAAETSLLLDPNVFVALALNATEDSRERRLPIERILDRTAPRIKWHLALAVPDMTSWIRNDSRFDACMREEIVRGRSESKIEVAVQFKHWVQQFGPFNLEEASRTLPELAALNTFLSQSILAAAA